MEVIDPWLEDMIEVLKTGFERTWYCCNKCNIVLEDLYTMMQVIEAAIKASDCTLGYQFDPSIRWNIVVSRFHLIDGF